MLIREKDRDILPGIFNSIELSVEIWANGSRVSGSVHSGSDLDLVMRSANLKAIPIDLFRELKGKIRHSNVAILVDLFD